MGWGGGGREVLRALGEKRASARSVALRAARCPQEKSPTNPARAAKAIKRAPVAMMASPLVSSCSTWMACWGTMQSSRCCLV